MTKIYPEEDFLEAVRKFADIGYGRMIQIVKYEWSETQPSRAAMEFPRGVPKKYLTVDEMMEMKASDPLAEHWNNWNVDDAPVHPVAGSSRPGQ